MVNGVGGEVLPPSLLDIHVPSLTISLLYTDEIQNMSLQVKEQCVLLSQGIETRLLSRTP